MKIENPNGIIKIRFDGFLSCLYIKKPRAVDWSDCGGSVARYFACLPFDEFDRELQSEIENRISSIQSIEELKESGFLDLLETGEYEFELWENKPTSLIFNTNLLNSNSIIHWWHKKEIGKHRGARPYSLNSFYPYGRQLMFTQPFESLNHKRIKFYEEKIKNGKKPLSIALRVRIGKQDDEDSYQDTSYNSTKYILDGHHKLVAYQNLKINPNYILINRTQNSIDEEYDESSLPNLIPYLFYYQIEHIVNNGLESIKHTPKLTKYIDDFLSNAPRVEDNLIRTFNRSVNFEGYEENETKRKWFKERLEVLKKRIKNNSEFHLDYYSPESSFRKYERVNNWDEILKLMKEKL